MEERLLTKDELKALKKESPDNFVILLGQDHFWYLYSDKVNGYLCLDLKGSEIEEEGVRSIVKEDKPYLENAFWIFGEVDI